MNKNRRLPTFIDEKKFLSRYENHKIKNTVIYKRLSDDSLSMGDIRWFELNEKNGKMYVVVIDHILGNFQTCAYLDIDPNLSEKQLDTIREKVVKTRRR